MQVAFRLIQQHKRFLFYSRHEPRDGQQHNRVTGTETSKKWLDPLMKLVSGGSQTSPRKNFPIHLRKPRKPHRFEDFIGA